jgi:hypothetical protein
MERTFINSKASTVKMTSSFKVLVSTPSRHPSNLANLKLWRFTTIFVSIARMGSGFTSL